MEPYGGQRPKGQRPGGGAQAPHQVGLKVAPNLLCERGQVTSLDPLITKGHLKTTHLALAGLVQWTGPGPVD